MIYGYARTSTDGQSVEAEAHHLTAAGDRNYLESACGERIAAHGPAADFLVGQQ